MIGNEIGKSLGVRTADCVPILLLDSRFRAIAAVHAGWRGTAAQIAAHTVERMRTEFHSDAQDLYAALGPCIRPCCYEVGVEVAAQFESLGAVRATNGARRLDLALANRRQLERAGLGAEHIFDCGLCTACSAEQFFSYRREPGNLGRMLASICRLA
jgi:polyphenol oxidase